MDDIKIVFSSENTAFQINDEKKFAAWIKQIIQEHKKILGDINFIFCSDSYLHTINVEHLNHDTYTDIITFDYSNLGIISGDLFISVDRIKENASQFKVSFENELNRVMAHGILHLIGFNDKSKEEISAMRNEEEKAIILFESN